MAHILIAEARFYDNLNDMLIAGARAAIEAASTGTSLIGRRPSPSGGIARPSTLT